MNITETISLLDELREKIEKWQFENSEDARTYIQYKFFLQLQALRQAALDGERYREAGEALVKTYERLALAQIDNGGFIELFVVRKDLADAISTYRQAVEQKEV